MNNKLIVTAIGVTIAIIVLGSILVPVVDDAKYHMGDTETYSNAENEKAVGDYKLVDSLTLSYISATEISNGTHVYARSDADVNERVILSDAFLLYVVPAENHAYFQLHTATSRTTIVSDFSAVLENGVYTIHNNNQDFTGTYSWIATQVEEGTGDYTEIINIATTSAYLKTINQIYTAQYDSNLGWVSINAGVANGSLEVLYDTVEVPDTLGEAFINIGVTDGINTMNPFATIVPKEVVYISASEGGIVSLLDALPVFVIVAIMLGVIGVAIPMSRR